MDQRARRRFHEGHPWSALLGPRLLLEVVRARLSEHHPENRCLHEEADRVLLVVRLDRLDRLDCLDRLDGDSWHCFILKCTGRWVRWVPMKMGACEGNFFTAGLRGELYEPLRERQSRTRCAAPR